TEFLRAQVLGEGGVYLGDVAQGRGVRGGSD
ncbi:MAG: hypothetical protein RIQ53_4159, partial [Pseudomonadota bacterium]